MVDLPDLKDLAHAGLLNLAGGNVAGCCILLVMGNRGCGDTAYCHKRREDGGRRYNRGHAWKHLGLDMGGRI